jgi:hypothetical protein
MTTIDPAQTAAAFRTLREAWFNLHLRETANHRETEDEAVSRAERNDALRTVYDQQTYAIICGNRGMPVAPVTADGVYRVGEATG